MSRRAEIIRKSQLKCRYGLTVEAYDRLYAQQGGACALCRKHSSSMKKRLAVDHNHVTGVVRGLLCWRCNTQLGLFHVDDPARARAFAKYLGVE